MPQDRYPGPRSFENNESHIFKGRSKEIEELSNYIRLEQIVVLFSKSGLGKSSLLNAGVGPKLPNYGYQPIRIRFQPQGALRLGDIESIDTPLSLTKRYIADEFNLTYHDIQSKLDKWKAELLEIQNNARPGGQRKRSELDRILHKQVETLVDLNSLSDAQLNTFKAEQMEVTGQYAEHEERVSILVKSIEAATLAISNTTLDSKGVYRPKNLVDPFGNCIEQSLWAFLKSHPFPNDEIPVLFFDQFEEFFSSTQKSQEEFTSQLSELLSSSPPVRVSEQVSAEIQNIDRSISQDLVQRFVLWGRQFPAKCVFAIRDDRLSEIDSLEKHIPLILRNRYKLNPLDAASASNAILGPAWENGDFNTPKFRIQNFSTIERKSTVSIIIEGLAGEKGDIDSTQLQMVCSKIEAIVRDEIKLAREQGRPPIRITERGSNDSKFIVDERIVANSDIIRDFISEYYISRINEIGDLQDVHLVSTTLEDYFTFDGKRVGVASSVLLKYLNGRKDLVDRMIESRLIRPEVTSWGTSYELSHDKLVEPVELSKKNRLTQESESTRKLVEKRHKKRLRYLGIGAVLFIGLLLAAIRFLIGLQQQYRNYYSNSINAKADQLYNLGKQDLAYKLWTDNLEGKPLVDSVDKLLKSRSFSAFSGSRVYQNPKSRFTIVQYKDDSINVFVKSVLDSSYRKIKSSLFSKRVVGTTLVGDFCLQVLESEESSDFPRNRQYRIVNLARNKFTSIDGKPHYTCIRTSLSENGNYLSIVDTLNNVRIYQFIGDEFKLIRNFKANKLGSKIKDFEDDRVAYFFPGERGFAVVSYNNESSVIVSNFRVDSVFVHINIVSYSKSGEKLVLEKREFNTSKYWLLDLRTLRKINVGIVSDSPQQINFGGSPYEVNLAQNDSILVLKDFSEVQHDGYRVIRFVNIYKSNKSFGNFSLLKYSLAINGEFYLTEHPSDSTLYIFNLKSNDSKKFPFKKGFFEILNTNGVYSLIKDTYTGNVFLFNLLSLKKILLTPAVPKDFIQCYIEISKWPSVYCAINDKLIKISIFEDGDNAIIRNVESYYLRNFELNPSSPVSFLVDTSMVSLRTRNGMNLVIYRDQSLNRIEYLSKKIYPSLTSIERTYFGLRVN